MGFIEILLLFVCFCLISAGIRIIEKVINARLVKVQMRESVDTVFNSIFRSLLKYHLEFKEMTERKGKE